MMHSLSRRINQDDPHPDPDDTVEPDRLPAGAIPPAPGPSTGETRQRSAIDELFGVEKSLHGVRLA